MASSNNHPTQELEKFCNQSNANLSAEGLRARLDDVSQSSFACSFFFHELCSHPDVSIEMVELVLEMSPYASFLCTNKYHGRKIIYDGDMGREEFVRRQRPSFNLISDRSYAIHLACANPNCPPEVIISLAKSNPTAVGHPCLLGGGCKPSQQCDPVVGLPLHYYLTKASMVNLDVVKCLVEMYPTCLDDTGACNPAKYHPIHALMGTQSSDSCMHVVEYLIEIKPELVQLKDGDLNLPIHLALKNNHVPAEVADFLIKTWPDCIFHHDVKNRFPIHSLLLTSRDDIVSFLDIFRLFLDKFRGILGTPSPLDGSYPLHLAAGCQPPLIIKILIDECPESVKKVNKQGKLPFHIACEHGTFETVKLLHDLYPECVMIADNQDLRALHFSVVRKDDCELHVLKFLLRRDPDGACCVTAPVMNGDRIIPNDDDPDRYRGFTPLHYAVEKGASMEVIRRLFDRFPHALGIEATRANPIIADGFQSSSAHVELTLIKIARIYEHSEAYQFFHQQKSAFAMYCAHPFPLLKAIQNEESLGLIKLVATLLPLGYESIIDEKKNTPLHDACVLGRVDIVNYLLENWPMQGNMPNNEAKYPIDLLLETTKCVDRDSFEYIEALWHLLTSNPQATGHLY